MSEFKQAARWLQDRFPEYPVKLVQVLRVKGHKPHGVISMGSVEPYNMPKTDTVTAAQGLMVKHWPKMNFLFVGPAVKFKVIKLTSGTLIHIVIGKFYRSKSAVHGTTVEAAILPCLADLNAHKDSVAKYFPLPVRVFASGPHIEIWRAMCSFRPSDPEQIQIVFQRADKVTKTDMRKILVGARAALRLTLLGLVKNRQIIAH